MPEITFASADMPPDELDTPASAYRAADAHRAIAAILVLVAVGGAVDLAMDAPRNWRSTHVIFEVSLMLASLGFAAWLWHGWRTASRSLAAAERTFAEHEARFAAEREAWRAGAQASLDDLGRAIDRQFDLWHLTPTEREVALLLLKGHGHKQIAARTGRSERTVRQHSVAVYQKSGLSGRAELAGFFLEGLATPRER